MAELVLGKIQCTCNHLIVEWLTISWLATFFLVLVKTVGQGFFPRNFSGFTWWENIWLLMSVRFHKLTVIRKISGGKYLSSSTILKYTFEVLVLYLSISIQRKYWIFYFSFSYFSNEDLTYKTYDQFIKYDLLLQIKLLQVYEVVKIGFTLKVDSIW